MKIVVAEPLGLPVEEIVAVCRETVGEDIELKIYEDRAADEAELICRCSDAEIIVEVNQPLTASFFEKCPNLQYVAVAFAGIDHIDMEACAAHGVKVGNCPGYSASAVAELVFGYLAVLKRNLLDFDAAVRKGDVRGGFVGTEIGGKTFGIIGFGHIGAAVARIALAYGCEVLAYSRTPKNFAGVSFVSLEELLHRSDIVSLHLPLTDASRGMIDAEQIAMMKEGAFLINTARGPIVDSAALAAALDSGHLGGAGIDVFETEPPISPDHPLLQCGKLIATPHIGFATVEAFETRLQMSFQNIADFLTKMK